jgi:hypothetical protein
MLAVSYFIISVRVKEVDVDACNCCRSCKILRNIVTCLPFVWFYALLDLFTAHIQDMGRQQTFIWRNAVLLFKFICSVRYLTVHYISLQEAKEFTLKCILQRNIRLQRRWGWTVYFSLECSCFQRVLVFLLFETLIEVKLVLWCEKWRKNYGICTYEIS